MVGFFVLFCLVNFFNKSEHVVYIEPEYMKLSFFCLSLYKPFTLNHFPWKYYDASTNNTNTFVSWLLL